MSIVERLKQYMEYLGMPSTQFADIAKVSRPTLSQILNGRNRKISNELIEKIHEAFPTLNIMWLLFGDGDIELGANTQTSEPQTQLKTPEMPRETIDFNDVTRDPEPIAASQFSLRSSNIDEFMRENVKNASPNPTSGYHDSIQQVTSNAHENSQRRIKSIMVFYSDSSFEIFTPSV